MLGFEKTIFTVKEEDQFVELCVNVFFPTAIDPITGLLVEIEDIEIITRSLDGTAGTTTRFKIHYMLW